MATMNLSAGPRRRDELEEIRLAASGATKKLSDFQRALNRLRTRGVRAIQQEAQTMRKTMANRYQHLGLYADRRGVLRKIRKPGAKHQRRKKQLGLDPRPGIMRKGVLKTLQSPRVIIKTVNGFVYDLKAPNITVTGRATIGKALRNLAGKRLIDGKGKRRRVVGTGIKRQVTNRRSFRVNSYIDAFAKGSAPGLGSLSGEDKRQLNRAALKAVNDHLASVGKAGAFRLSSGELLTITVRASRLTSKWGA